MYIYFLFYIIIYIYFPEMENSKNSDEDDFKNPDCLKHKRI